MRLVLSAALAASVALGSALAASPLYVTADRLLDVKSGTYVANAAVVIEDGVITATGPAATLPAPDGAAVIALVWARAHGYRPALSCDGRRCAEQRDRFRRSSGSGRRRAQPGSK